MGGSRLSKVFSTLLLSCFVLCTVSPPSWAANAVAEDPVEKSSPEELKQRSLPGLRALPKEVWPTVIPMEDWQELSEAQGMTGLSGTWTPGVAPYQINPITAIMTAGVVLAVQSLKEQGRIDHQALWRLLNSTDFYAGIVGAVAAAKTKEGLVKAGGAALTRVAPESFKEFGKKQAVQLFGNIMNAFSYTLAVSSGFEYFSQFWKLSTQDIPNVSKVSDLVGASKNDIVRVLSNLLQYAVHPDVQKRILASVKYHRIYTFEFIAMNVGLFVGVFVGDQVAKRIGPKASQATKKAWSQKLTLELGRFFGGVLGGLAVEFIPDSFKIRVNTKLLNWKIAGVRADLTKVSGSIEQGIRYKYYPPYHSPSVGSFFAQSLNLQSDVRRLLRTRDLLYSLYAHRYFLTGIDDQLQNEIAREQEELEGRVLEWIGRAGGVGPSSAIHTFDEKMLEDLSPQELENWIYQDIRKDDYERHYTRVLHAGMENLQSSYDDFDDFLSSLYEFQNSEAEGILREIPTIDE